MSAMISEDDVAALEQIAKEMDTIDSDYAKSVASDLRTIAGRIRDTSSAINEMAVEAKSVLVALASEMGRTDKLI